jgi:hypothetical protein
LWRKGPRFVSQFQVSASKSFQDSKLTFAVWLIATDHCALCWPEEQPHVAFKIHDQRTLRPGTGAPVNSQIAVRAPLMEVFGTIAKRRTQRSINGTVSDSMPGVCLSGYNLASAGAPFPLRGRTAPLARDMRWLKSHGRTPPGICGQSGRAHRQKSLNRWGDNSVYRTVCWMFRWPR